MPNGDLEAPQIIEEDIVEVVIETAREVNPVQFFHPNASLADRDFRPQVLKSEATAAIVLDPSEAHDPSISPIPEREYFGELDDPEGAYVEAPQGAAGPFDS